MLGAFRAEHGSHALTRFRTHKTASLLAFLAFYRDRSHPRDELADLLWPDVDPSAARASLRTGLNSLRNQLEPPDKPVGSILIADRSFVRLQPVAVTTDVAAFRSALVEANAADSAPLKFGLLSRAVNIYGGDLLPGFYEDWVFTERQRLVQLQLGALSQLRSIAESTGDLQSALDFALDAAAIEPTSEDLQNAVMRIYHRSGRPAEALRHYKDVERIFRDQLDMEPPEESRKLIKSLNLTQDAYRQVTVKRSRRGKRIVSDGSASSAPRRPDAPARPTSIPEPMSAFFGRQQELAHIENLLLKGAHARPNFGHVSTLRLLTLVGPGGSGKSRTALELAGRLARAYNNQIWFVSLGGLSQQEQIPEAVLDSMQLAREMEGDWYAPIRNHLYNVPALLVLDNFEHLADGGATYVEHLLEGCGGLVCLTTSRVRLNLPGERVINIAPLPIPSPLDPEKLLSLFELCKCPSIQLFVDRAQAARADFQITEANASDVAELCRHLEGIPLALELAASWAQVLTPHQMLDRTRERLRLAVSPRKGGSERHRSLRAAVEWSYRLLNAEHQLLFQQLSVFRGGWNALGALAVCNANHPSAETVEYSEHSMLESLTCLAEASLINTEEVGLLRGPEIRFSMLETLREFGRELLTQQEFDALRAKHALHFLAQAEQYSFDIHTKFRDHLDPDLDNLRAALHWSATTPGQGEVALRLANAMFGLWVYWGHFTEALEWMERVLGFAVPSSDLLADSLNTAGNICFYMKNGAASLAYHERQLAVRREIGDDLGAAKALSNMGNALVTIGKCQEALPLHEESVAIIRRCVAIDTSVSGMTSEDCIRKDRAVKYLPGALLNLADSLGNIGDAQGASDRLWESLREYARLGADNGVARCYMALGEQKRRKGDLEAACDLLERAIAACPASAHREVAPIVSQLIEIREAIALRTTKFDD